MVQYKRLETGKKLLSNVKRNINRISSNEGDIFYYQRFIFQRLKGEEDTIKRNIKKRLLNKNSKCYFCNKKLPKKDIIVHRLNEKKGYKDNNVVFAHRKCHINGHNSK